MNVSDLIDAAGAWLTPGQAGGPAVSSRMRLARNLREAAFPGWAGEDECQRIWESVSGVLGRLEPLEPGFTVAMDEVNDLERQILFERHLISREQAQKGKGSGLICSEDESVGVMVNEEDHLRIQAFRPGLDLAGAWQRVNELDDAIEQELPYAFSPKLGYLTACPSNVGTGMRASVMLHLPGLCLMDEINPIMKGLGKIGLAVRGLWGEGTEAIGHMFQISNQVTLGEDEEEIRTNLEQIVSEVVEHEKNARARLRRKRSALLRDHVGRAYGILTNAHLLASKEALDLLSGLRLGLDLGILSDVDAGPVSELMLLTQPAHLQKIVGKKLSVKERDRARASLVRERLAGPTELKRKKPGTRNQNE